MTGQSPQRLHAIANLWSLVDVWPKLAQAAQSAAEALDPDRGTVQAWRPGSGVHSGRTGDHILDAILRSVGVGAPLLAGASLTRVDGTEQDTPCQECS